VLHMAKQLESCLHKQSCSFDSYQDKSTLKHRLDQVLAIKSGLTIQDDTSHQVEEVRVPLTTAPTSCTMVGTGVSGHAGNAGCCSCMSVGHQPCHASAPRLIRGPIIIGDTNTLSHSCNSLTGVSNMDARTAIDRSFASQPQTMRTVDVRGNVLCHPSLDGTMPSGNGQNQIEDIVRINRSRHQQERLLSLHHAAKCRHEEGRCPVSLDCADMKSLWKHLEGCKAKNCTVPFCFSSRAILSHHSKCEDQACPVCVQVHATVKGSHNRRPQDLNQISPEVVAIGWNASDTNRDGVLSAPRLYPGESRSEGGGESIAAYECHTPLVCAVPVEQDQPLDDNIELPVIVLRSEEIVGTALPLTG
jgi:hypothetical protein